MSTLTPSTLLDLVYRSLDLTYQRGYMAAPQYMMPTAMSIPSSGDQNVYGWMDLVPQVREWIGDRVFQNLVAQEYRLPNKHYELSVEVDKDKIEDQQVAIYGPAVEMMGRQMKVWPDILLTQALQAGASTVTFDGQFFFDTDHPIDTTGETTTATQSNKFALALSAANYASVLASGKQLKGRDNTVIGAFDDPRSNLLVVGAALEKTAREILHGEYISVAGGSTQTNVWQNSAQLLVNPRLGATEWYLLDAGKPVKPFIWQERQAPVFVQLTAADSAPVFTKNKYQFGADMRGAAGYGLYFFALQGNV